METGAAPDSYEVILREFLAHYSQKNLEAISAMLASDVLLRDWNLEVIGKESALRQFAKNFEEAESIKIAIERVFCSATGVCAELSIVVNEKELLSVVDVLGINPDKKIASIISYKGL